MVKEVTNSHSHRLALEMVEEYLLPMLELFSVKSGEYKKKMYFLGGNMFSYVRKYFPRTQ